MNKLKKWFNHNPWKFIWGISACGGEASLYQANDCEISYNTKTKKYHMWVETAFLFETTSAMCDYLEDILDKFTKYMLYTNRSINEEFPLFCSQLSINCTTDTIEELYRNFSIFVKGYCAFYKYST